MRGWEGGGGAMMGMGGVGGGVGKWKHPPAGIFFQRRLFALKTTNTLIGQFRFVQTQSNCLRFLVFPRNDTSSKIATDVANKWKIAADVEATYRTQNRLVVCESPSVVVAIPTPGPNHARGRVLVL